MSGPANSPSIASAGPSPEDRLDEVIAGYLRAVRSGNAPDPQKLLTEHPDLAGELSEFFADQKRFNNVAGPLRAAVSPFRLPSEIGPHMVLGEIARGGMGVVLRARHRDLGRLVAIKLLLAGPNASEEDIQRFAQEAEAAANLDHPHIVPIYEVGKQDGAPYFSMKLMQSSLAQRLRSASAASPNARTPSRTDPTSGAGKVGSATAVTVEPPSGRAASASPTNAGRMDPREAARLVFQVARGVHHAHQRGFLHRDLKPANILLDEQGQPLVSDFGLARRRGAPRLTQAGTLLGTPAYMAPEQATGRGEVTVATDVYGIGTILYECLTGQPPFKSEAPVQTLRLIVEGKLTPPRTLNPDIDADLEAVCVKCLQKDPAQRYASAHALAEDLHRYLRSEAVSARPAGPFTHSLLWLRRQPVVAALTAALVTVVVAGLGLVLYQWQRAEQGFAEARAQRDAVQHALDEASRERQIADASVRVARAALDRATQASREADRAARATEVQFRRADAAVLETRKALEKAEQARRQADEAARISEVHFHQAHAVVNDFCLSFSEELAHTPGLQPLRRKLLNAALRYYKDFVRERTSDPALQRELADTHIRLAQITSAIGERGETLSEYRAALALYRKLHQESPGDLDVQRKLTGTLLSIASREPVREGLATSAEALKLYEQFLAARPDNADLQSGMASLLATRGTQLITAGRYENGRESLERALSRQDELVRQYPRSDVLRSELSSTLHNYGVLLERNNKRFASLCCYQRAYDLREPLAAVRPHDVVQQASLADLCFHGGLVLRALGQPDSAREAFAAALALRRKLAADNPQVVRCQCDLAASLSCQAQSLTVVNKRDQALHTYEDVHALLAALVKRDPTAPLPRKMLAENLFDMGVTYGMMNRRTEEADAYTRARRIQEELLHAAPDNVDYRAGLGRTLNNLGLNLYLRKQLAQAKEVLGEAVASTRRLLEQAPGVMAYRKLLNAHYGSLAEIEWREGRADESVKWTLLRQQLWPNDPGELLRAVGELTRAASLLGRDPQALPLETRKRQEQYLDLAMAALRQAVRAGFDDADQLRKDPALQMLQSRPDFRELAKHITP